MAERTVLLITVLVGAVGWLFTHLVERVSNSPTIEYTIETIGPPSQQVLKLGLINVTRSTSFEDVRILLTAPKGGSISDVFVAPREPSFEGDVGPEVYGRSADIVIERFMPGAQLEISAPYTGRGRPAVRASAKDVPIHFRERGLETFFARREVEIFGGLAIFWLLLSIGIFASWFVRGRKKTGPGTVVTTEAG